MAVKVEAYVSHKGGKEIQVPAHERASWGSKGGRNLVKGDSGKPQVFFRLAGWEVRKGKGNWKMSFPRDLTEEQVRKTLELTNPDAKVYRWRKDSD